MARDRKGKFWWEYQRPHYITLQSMRGVYDPALTSDCRCGKECYNCEFGNCCELHPWMVLCSVEYWGEGVLTPEGLPDGDTLDPAAVQVPFEERVACDIEGRPHYLCDCDVEEENLEIYEAMRLEQEQEAVECDEFLEDDEFNVYSDSFDPLAEELAQERHADRENEIDLLMDEIIAIETHPLEKVNGYDHSLDEMPTKLSKSHRLVSACNDSNKDIRMMRKNGSFSHGWRGSDRYKFERNGKIRVSRGKLRKIAMDIEHPFVYDLQRGQAPRVPTV